MAQLTDEQAAAIIDRAHEAVHQARQLRAKFSARSDPRIARSERAERSVIAQHRAALARHPPAH